MAPVADAGRGAGAAIHDLAMELDGSFSAPNMASAATAAGNVAGFNSDVGST